MLTDLIKVAHTEREKCDSMNQRLHWLDRIGAARKTLDESWERFDEMYRLNTIDNEKEHAKPSTTTSSSDS